MLRITRKARENKRKKIIMPLPTSCLVWILILAAVLYLPDRPELREVQRNPARKLRG